MRLLALDKEFNTVEMVDSFNSLVWTERYWEEGEFELEGPVSQSLLNIALLVLNSQDDYYLFSSESDRLMIIESVVIKTDFENGNTITLSGPSAEAHLRRRIVLGTFVPGVYFTNTIQTLITDNFVSPKNDDGTVDTDRVFGAISYSADTTITEYPYYTEWDHSEVYQIIQEMHQNVSLGFKMVPNEEDGSWGFVTYEGVDRSYDQDETSPVRFSPAFANLIGSNYLRSNKDYKNVMLAVGGEHTITETSGDTTIERVILPEVTIYEKNTSIPSGPRRREVYYDGSSVSWEDEESTDEEQKYVSEDVYIQRLTDAGITELSKQTEIVAFDGEVEHTSQFVYGRDYFLGDIVEVDNEYNIAGRFRITEIVRTVDANDDKLIPTFVAV